MFINYFLAFILVVGILAISALIIFLEIGGKEALFLILGHLFAWGEMVVIFFYRKAPSVKRDL